MDPLGLVNITKKCEEIGVSVRSPGQVSLPVVHVILVGMEAYKSYCCQIQEIVLLESISL